MLKKLILPAIITFALFSSCQKDSAPVCTLSNSSIVGTYKTTASTIQANATATPVDNYATWPACEKDDLLTFSADGTLTSSEGAVSCTPANNFTANWSLSGSSITISVMGFSQSATITDFNCSSFKVKSVDPTTGEITINTMTRQ